MGDAPITPPSSSSQISAPPPPVEQAQPPSFPEPQVVSPNIILQAPLSRRGKGPGLVLVLDHYALIARNEKCLDPPPLQKWAEEGFAVVQVLVPGKVDDDGGEFPLQRALDVLRGCDTCEFGNGVGLISYLSRIPYYFEEEASGNPNIKALISYGGKAFATLGESSTPLPPQLIHIAGPEQPRRESFSIVPDSEPAARPASQIIKTYRYEDAKRDSTWILPSDEDYHKRNAGIAHTRSLTFLKPLLNGPYFDLEAVWEEHTKYEFGERDVEKTMATMVDQPYVNHIPTMTGGVGKERLTAFYTNHFIFSNPPDTSLSLVSRTVGIDRVIDEFIFSLTHTKYVPWLLPGIPPTGKPLAIPFTSIVAMRGDRLCHEHISWDHATLLKQAGLLPEYVPFPYEINGEAPPEGKRYDIQLPVVGMEGSRKLVDEGCEESNKLMGGQWNVVDDK